MSRYSDTESTSGNESIFTHPRGEAPRLDPLDQLTILGAELAENALSTFKNIPASEDQQSPSPSGFACPFFTHDPSIHRRCLRSNLLRIVDVKRHIWAYHRRPYNCPICSSIFGTIADRDRHIRADTCVAAPPNAELALTSVTAEQLTELARPSGAGRSKEDQWFAIWVIVFPGVAWPSVGPMLSDEVEVVRQVRELRDFWRGQGRGITEAFIGSKGVNCDRLGGLRRLTVVALNRMIDRLVTDFSPRS